MHHSPPDDCRRDITGPGLARRHFNALAGGLWLGAAPRARSADPRAQPGTAAEAGGAGRWSNWSGLQHCAPQQWQGPADENELAALLTGAPGPLRFVGAGHSFSPLVPTSGTLVVMDGFSGVRRHDAATQRVTVGAGMRIAALALQLEELGLALPNQGDIDVQSLAGSYATGTHGTGASLPALHAQVRALRLITPAGQLLEASRERRPELFDAARVSLGTLGALTEVELEVQPRFYLRRRVWTAPTEELLEAAPRLATAHRHFELFVLPHTGWSAGIVHDEVPAQPPHRAGSDDERLLTDLRRLRTLLGPWPALRRWMAGRLIGGREEVSVDLSWRLLSNIRDTRFNESEYHVPAEQGIACLREVLAVLERHNEAYFPIEFRHVAADDAWLSPFYQRASCCIAVHAAANEPYAYLLKEVGPVFRRHEGRPHWGKLHDMEPGELAELYPRWRDFLALRRELDPGGRLLNEHLGRLFGEPANG
ncbi:FAD-binding protein [Aquabacterium sp. A7-Y]|uniref:D-arabinono-1,4-lactone oxidase n=1 Tax=Aquabacterium sp. A7-Y TaxID=1349605 RepID=UPI00223E174B|nr:D-arabinono-1,4-lactone oxidase [Aquabacterium sp. A7-Y]MCW7537882.1 FAD-binding protein [Aquabacterium sp. A7-Y]